MATTENEKGARPKRKAQGSAKASAKPELGRENGNLKRIKDARSERRYLPKATGLRVVAMIVASVGTVALGAGFFGQVLRAEPHPYAVVMLTAGAVAIVLGFVLGFGSPPIVRVGDGGVALEKDGGEVQRIGWHELLTVELQNEQLLLRSAVATIHVPLATQKQAAARALAEAKKRVPERVEQIDGEIEALNASEGEVLTLEPAQVAGLVCKATGKAISFEEDVRLCGRCGETYHKEHVPKTCATCDAKLKD